MNQAAALLAIQDADIELMRLEKRLDSLPEKRAILDVRAKARQVTTLKSKAELLVRKLEAELKAHQDETENLTTKLQEEQAKLMAASDHRQVQSLSREMDGLKRRRDKVEMESLQLMERIEKARAQVGKVEDALAQLATTEKAYIERFQQVGSSIQSDIAKVRKQRTAAAKDIDTETLKTYESIRDSKGGIGVGRLDSGACTACRMTLPAERTAELEAGKDVSICPACRRLIVVRTGSEDQ